MYCRQLSIKPEKKQEKGDDEKLASSIETLDAKGARETVQDEGPEESEKHDSESIVKDLYNKSHLIIEP